MSCQACRGARWCSEAGNGQASSARLCPTASAEFVAARGGRRRLGQRTFCNGDASNPQLCKKRQKGANAGADAGAEADSGRGAFGLPQRGEIHAAVRRKRRARRRLQTTILQPLRRTWASSACPTGRWFWPIFQALSRAPATASAWGTTFLRHIDAHAAAGPYGGRVRQRGARPRRRISS